MQQSCTIRWIPFKIYICCSTSNNITSYKFNASKGVKISLFEHLLLLLGQLKKKLKRIRLIFQKGYHIIVVTLDFTHELSKRPHSALELKQKCNFKCVFGWLHYYLSSKAKINGFWNFFITPLAPSAPLRLWKISKKVDFILWGKQWVIVSNFTFLLDYFFVKSDFTNFFALFCGF